jgi:hypothetical protein
MPSFTDCLSPGHAALEETLAEPRAAAYIGKQFLSHGVQLALLMYLSTLNSDPLLEVLLPPTTLCDRMSEMQL